MTAVGNRPKTGDVHSDRQASSCAWHLALSPLALPDQSIDRRSYMQSDVVSKALFLTLKKALEQGMIRDDKDFQGRSA